MGKELSEMSLEELWELFPIFLVPPDDRWRQYYGEMEVRLKRILSRHGAERISHMGSTAFSGIWAKNIVDILIEMARGSDLELPARELEANGFIRMSAEEDRISLNAGYTKDGFAERVFHIHLRYAGDNDELYFRDYLNEHPEVAKEYEEMKLGLWKLYEHDRDGYTRAKTEFVGKWTSAARAAYTGRYD